MAPSLTPIDFKCPNCGANVPVNGSTRTVACPYCKREMLLPEELWRQLHPPAAQAPVAIVVPDIPVKAIRRMGLVIALVGGGVALLGVGIAVFAVSAATSAVSGVTGMAGGKPLDPLASAGDACNGRVAACSRDGKTELHCGAGNTLGVVGTCKGPNGCRASLDSKSIDCDVTLADKGDPCVVNDDACSTDHKSELRCQAGHFAVIATCKGPDGCTLTPAGKKGDGYTLSCDDHVADVGDPCFDAERTACSSDKKAYLTCNAQKFAVERACKGGCTVKKVAGTANKELDCR
jgi:hypothetical protein